MPKEGFLFVPYCAGQNGSANSKINASDARSHAAAVSRQRRDNLKLQQLGLKRLPNMKLVHIEDGKPWSRDGEQENVNTSTSPTGKSASLVHTESVGLVNGRRRQHMRAMQFSWRAGNVGSEWRLSTSIPLKLFQSSDLSRFGHTVIEYFQQVISPVNHPVYAIFNVTNVYTSYWMQLLEDEDYRPAGFAMVGAVMQRVTQPGSAPSTDIRYHQATAISRLQKKYNEILETGLAATDEMVIITVLALASLARLLGDLRGYETHKKSMKAMIASRGGLGTLGHDGLAKCTLLQWDSFWVFETQGAPLFSDSRPEHIPVYPAFPLSPEIRDIYVKLPIGFQSLILKSKISIELIEVLGRTADAGTAGIASLGAGTMYQSKHCKYNDFIEACPCLTISDIARTTLEKDITLALLLYCSNAFSTLRSNTALYASCRSELTRLLLKDNMPSISMPEKECLFWICLVCIDSWRQNESSSAILPQGEVLLPVLRKIRDSMDTESLIQKFFWYEDLLNAYPTYLDMAG